MMRYLSLLHRGSNDKYFSLLNTATRSVARLAVNLLIASLCGADVYGTFVILVSIEVIWTTLLGAGLVTPLLHMAPGLHQAQRDGLSRYVATQVLRVSLFVGIPAFILWALVGFSGLSGLVALGFAVATLLQGLLAALRSWRNLSFETWHVFWSDLFSVGIPILGALAGWFWLGADSVLWCFWWAMVLANLLAGLAIICFDRRRFFSGQYPDERLRLLLKTKGRPILYGSLAYSAGSRLQPIILALVATSVEVARFGGAAALVGPLRMLGMAISGVVRPRFGLYYHQADIAKVRRLMLLVCASVIGLGLTMAMLFVVVGDWLGTELLGGWYVHASKPLVLYTCYATIAGVTSFLVTALQVQSNVGSKFVAKARLLHSVMSLLLMWPACSYWGTEGAITVMAGLELVLMFAVYLRWWGADRERVKQPQV